MPAIGGRSARDIVRAHMHDTTTYVLAPAKRSDPAARAAASIQADIVRAFKVKKGPLPAGRRVVAIGRNDLATLEPKGSWLLIVLASSPEAVTHVAGWVRQRGMDATNRVQFYLAPKSNLAEGLSPWTDAGLPWPSADHWVRRVALRAVIGRAINDRIVQDFRDQ